MSFIPAMVLATLMVGAACSGSESTGPIPPAVDHDAQGSWGQNSGGVPTPGNFFLIAMTESAGMIAGTGSFAAAPYGSLSVGGAVANDSLHLRIIFLFEPNIFPQLRPDTALFLGRLTNRDQIDGMLTSHGVTRPLGLVRLQVNDPR
jgi:hypothetical protein